MSSIPNRQSLFISSWFVIAASIFATALVLRPMPTAFEYWLRIGWTEILNAIFWIGLAGWFIKPNSNTKAAITPSLSFISTFYCLFSFALMWGFYGPETRSGINKVHLVMQICGLAIYLVLCLRLKFIIAVTDDDIGKAKGCSPTFLASNIKTLEYNVTPDIAKELKELRETLSYSLQNNPRTRSNELYKVFESRVMSMLENPKMINITNISELKSLLKKLIISSRKD